MTTNIILRRNDVLTSSFIFRSCVFSWPVTRLQRQNVDAERLWPQCNTGSSWHFTTRGTYTYTAGQRNVDLVLSIFDFFDLKTGSPVTLTHATSVFHVNSALCVFSFWVKGTCWSGGLACWSSSSSSFINHCDKPQLTVTVKRHRNYYR